METVKYLVITEISMDKNKVKEIESWGEDITPETFIESIIKDHVADRGLLCKLEVIEGDIYKDVKEYAYVTLNHKAVEELEHEVLASKQCPNGICEDF